MSCPTVPLQNVEPSNSAAPPPDDELSPRSSFERFRTLAPKELVDHLTAEQFFAFYRAEVKVTFSNLMVPGALLLSSCWDPQFNIKELGIPAGPAYRLSRIVTEIYEKAGMSPVLAPSSTCH
jgi:hypothetical protein